MARAVGIPDPTPTLESLLQTSRALKEAVEALQGAPVATAAAQTILDDATIAEIRATLGLPKVEGIWSPAFRGETTPGTNTVTITSATYARLGPLVLASTSFALATVSVAGTGNANITGLPFSANAICTGKLEGSSSVYGALLPQAVRTVAGESFVRLTHINTATGLLAFSSAGFPAGSQFAFSIVYTTSDPL